MEPRIRGVNYDQDAKAATGDDTPHEVQTREMGLLKRRQLTETFGNQKSRSQALQAERGVVKEEALGDADEIETLFQEAGQNDALLTTDQVLQQANMSLSRNVPPHDVTATTPEGAYPLDRLIMQEEWKALDVKEIKVAAKKSSAEEALRQSDTYPNFVLSRLRRIRVEGDKEGNKKRAHILVYLRHLLAFNNASASLIRKAAADPLGNPGLSGHGKPVDLADELSIPGVVVARFLKQFTSETFSTDDRFGGRQRGKDHRDLLVSYVLVLGLAVDDFQTDPFDLAVELKMTLSEIRPHYRELGCKFERCSAGERQELGDSMQNMQGKWKVTLPVPLQFPQVVTSRGRSRRGR
ncbi:hypothetical protein CY35_16G000700 [Sphagnum magellanicum]|nr:hypothetical protein CY35_16G000700 [Sphagnum magellanicum]